MKEINLNDVVVQGTNKRKVNVSIPNVTTAAHQAVNNLNGTLARPYTGVTQDYQSMMPQQSRVDTNDLNLDTSGLKPVKPRVTPKQVEQASLSRRESEVYKKNKPFSYRRRMYGIKYDPTGETIPGNEIAEFNDNNKGKYRASIFTNPAKDGESNFGYYHSGTVSNILNGDQLSSSDIYSIQNNPYLSDEVKSRYLPKGDWNMDNTKAYLDSIGMNYGNNQYARERNIEETMYQLNNPNLKNNSFGENSWNKIQSGADQFLTNYNAVQDFKNRVANGTAFGRRPVSAKFGTKIKTLKGGDNIPEYINEYYEERPDALYVAKPIYVERRASNGFGGGSFGDGSFGVVGGSQGNGSIIARQKPERKKRTPVVSNGKKKKKEKQVTPLPQGPQEPRTIDLEEITVLGGPDPRRVTLPQIEVNTDLPPVEYVDVPTHFTRKMVRQALRNQGINPYDLSGVERRALRHKLNGNYDDYDAALLNSNSLFIK